MDSISKRKATGVRVARAWAMPLCSAPFCTSTHSASRLKAVSCPAVVVLHFLSWDCLEVHRLLDSSLQVLTG